MDLISVINQKGGSGKTTLALHVAIAATQKGRVVSVIDLDAQKSAEKWWELRADQAGENDPAIASGRPANLARMIEVARREDSDLVIIDTPPQSSRAMIHAADMADLVIVPTRLSVLDTFALDETLELLAKAGVSSKCVVLVNGARGKQEKALSIVKALARQHGVTVAASVLEELPDLANALAAGLGVSELNARGKAALRIQAIYRYLTRRLASQKAAKRRRVA